MTISAMRPPVFASVPAPLPPTSSTPRVVSTMAVAPAVPLRSSASFQARLVASTMPPIASCWACWRASLMAASSGLKTPA
ncbi:hypothetical protein D9M70_570200 [compost metagenome]